MAVVLSTDRYRRVPALAGLIALHMSRFRGQRGHDFLYVCF
jgi:hypothetical protein